MPRWTARFACFISLTVIGSSLLAGPQAQPAVRLGRLPSAPPADHAVLALNRNEPPAPAAEPGTTAVESPATAGPLVIGQVATPAPTQPTAAGDAHAAVAGTETGASATATPVPQAAPLVPASQVSSARLEDRSGLSGTRPVALRIDALGLSAGIVATGFVPGTDELAVPDSTSEAGWYAGGVVPGEAGTALIAGHVDLTTGARGPFFLLGQAKPDMRIVLTFADGSQRTFGVIARESYPQDALPVDRLLASQGESLLALITCGGRFDRQTRHYTENVVVYAKPVAS